MVAFVASEYARSNRVWQGNLPISSFVRLPEALGHMEGSVSIRLEFTFDANGRVHVVGCVVAPAELMCYTCMKVRKCEVNASIDMRVVYTEDEAREIFAEFDAVVLDDGPTTIQDLIEDDVLLSIPTSVCTDAGKCSYRPQDSKLESRDTYRPFEHIGHVVKSFEKRQTN